MPPAPETTEMTAIEARRVVEHVRALDRHGLLFLTGDPFRRPDLEHLVEHAAGRGLAVTLASGSRAITAGRLTALRNAGLSRLAVRMRESEASERGRQDRREPQVMATVDAAARVGLPLQIETWVNRATWTRFDTLARRVEQLTAALWVLVFPVRFPVRPVGVPFAGLTPELAEAVLRDLAQRSLSAPYDIVTVEAPQYRRVAWQAADQDREGRPPVPRRRGHPPTALRAGDRSVFIDHAGRICPGPSLPVPRGDVRADDLANVYWHDELLRRLRNSDALVGKCRRCGFREACGGSRARAFAATGALMASDPLCAYDPGPEIRPLVGLQSRGEARGERRAAESPLSRSRRSASSLLPDFRHPDRFAE
jgi:radical SAM protein with 4Fe4S-binding SPASM domain